MLELWNEITVYLVSFLLLSGAGFALLAAWGIVKLPDLPNRLHASTKAGALGASLLLLAVAIAIPQVPVIAQVVAIVVFIILTSPVSAHVLGRTGYFVGVPLWKGTLRDDLAGHYDRETHALSSGLEDEDDDEDEDEDDEDEEEEAEESNEMDEPSEEASEDTEAPAESEDAEDGKKKEVTAPTESADDAASTKESVEG
jgi:multicomponent Na+:H+ antiporter subunit G